MRYKITLLSIVVVTLILGAGILGFVLGSRTSPKPEVSGVATQQSATPVSRDSSSEASLTVTQATPSASSSPAESLTNQFYTWYLDCLKANGACDYNVRGEVDRPVLSQKIKDKAVTGYDPVLCAQNVPNTFRIDHITNDSPSRASVYLVESFSDDQVQLIVETEQKGSEWKITNIICPRP